MRSRDPAVWCCFSWGMVTDILSICSDIEGVTCSLVFSSDGNYPHFISLTFPLPDPGYPHRFIVTNKMKGVQKTINLNSGKCLASDSLEGTDFEAAVDQSQLYNLNQTDFC